MAWNSENHGGDVEDVDSERGRYGGPYRRCVGESRGYEVEDDVFKARGVLEDGEGGGD